METDCQSGETVGHVGYEVVGGKLSELYPHQCHAGHRLVRPSVQVGWASSEADHLAGCRTVTCLECYNAGSRHHTIMLCSCRVELVIAGEATRVEAAMPAEPYQSVPNALYGR